MSDDLVAKAANWVPPWQRPADEQSGGHVDADAGAGAAEEPASGSASGAPGQWDRLAGARWQTVRQDESTGESGVDDESAPDPELSDPQLSDCVTEDGDSEPADEEAVSWNARKPTANDAVSANDAGGTGVEVSPQVEVSADDGSSDAVLSEDERVALALSGVEEQEQDHTAASPGGGTAYGDDTAEPAAPGSAQGLSEDERVAAVLAGDEAAMSAGAAVGQGQLFVPAQRASEEERPVLGEAELVPALEAILMVVDEPVGEILLAQVLEVPAERIADALLGLSAKYTQEGRGFDLRRAAGGWRFYTRAEYSAYVEKFVLDGQQLRLTQASLETLAVVAYKQPVTRSRISAIRGVNCDGVVRTLVTRGLIEECGTEPESGAHLYKTTNLFLEKLGLDSVEQLPPLAPFLPDNLDEVALNE